MKIGLLLPSLLMTPRYDDRIFAPKSLFISLVNGLVDRGHTVYVYSASNVKTKGILIEGNKELERERLPSKKLGLDHSVMLMRYKPLTIEYEVDLTANALKHAQAAKLDIMHTYHDFLIRYFAQLVPQLPLVYTLHDALPSADTLEGWRLDHFSHENYVAISRNQADEYRKRVHVTGVVYHGLDAETFSFSAQKDNYLAFLGRLVPEKGALDAVEVARRLSLPLKISTSKFYYGNPYFVNRVKPHVDGKIVSLLGFLRDDEKTNFLKHARAFLFPIHWEEPFGMVMLEALACGTPVVAYNYGSVPEIIKDGITGFIVNDDSAGARQGKWVIEKRGVAGLVEAVKRISEIDPHACRRHVEENFTIEKMVQGYEVVYQKILQSKS